MDSDMPVLLYLFNSAMAGPLQDPAGTEYRCERDPSPQKEVLLLRPERGREGPGATESTLRTGGSALLYVLPYHSLSNESGFQVIMVAYL